MKIMESILIYKCLIEYVFPVSMALSSLQFKPQEKRVLKQRSLRQADQKLLGIKSQQFDSTNLHSKALLQSLWAKRDHVPLTTINYSENPFKNFLRGVALDSYNSNTKKTLKPVEHAQCGKKCCPHCCGHGSGTLFLWNRKKRIRRRRKHVHNFDVQSVSIFPKKSIQKGKRKFKARIKRFPSTSKVNGCIHETSTEDLPLQTGSTKLPIVKFIVPVFQLTFNATPTTRSPFSLSQMFKLDTIYKSFQRFLTRTNIPSDLFHQKSSSTPSSSTSKAFTSEIHSTSCKSKLFTEIITEPIATSHTLFEKENTHVCCCHSVTTNEQVLSISNNPQDIVTCVHNQLICGTTQVPVQITNFVEIPQSLNFKSINPLPPNSSSQYIIISLDHLPQEIENLFLNNNINLDQQSSDIFSPDLSSCNTFPISTPMQLSPTCTSATEEEPNYMTESSFNLDEDSSDVNLPEDALDHMLKSLDFKQLEKFINLAIKEGRYVIRDVPKGVETSSQH